MAAPAHADEALYKTEGLEFPDRQNQSRGEGTMRDLNSRALALLHPGFVAAGAVLLIAAFVTDILCYRTSLMQRSNFSAWLIVFGLVLAPIAAILLAIDFAIDRGGRVSASRAQTARTP
jgi:uncharacterized membrane protein